MEFPEDGCIWFEPLTYGRIWDRRIWPAYSQVRMVSNLYISDVLCKLKDDNETYRDGFISLPELIGKLGYTTITMDGPGHS